jgi:mannonate dehydratase
MLNRHNFRFARQCGCTHLIIHLAEYYQKEIVTATGGGGNYGVSRSQDPVWSFENMEALQKTAREEGLEIYGIENFSPADWYDIILDGPEKESQLEGLKEIIRNAGRAGIRAFGYNFSLAGVWGHQKKPAGRGGALSVCFDAGEIPIDDPIPLGEVWNMTYNPSLASQGFLPETGAEELWQRLEWFLRHILPVAEEAGVDLALHPDDPPMPILRRTPRLVYRAELYQRLLDLVPSRANKIELCMGSIQEMPGSNIEEVLQTYGGRGKISYIHFRNVMGKIPSYREVFVDEGDISMPKCVRILKDINFDGLCIPDHTPEMLCGAPWHAGMAYTLGYMQALCQVMEEGMSATEAFAHFGIL